MVVNQRFLYGKMMEHGGKSDILKWENDGTWWFLNGKIMEHGGKSEVFK